jgi:Tol biopolymer transport system component
MALAFVSVALVHFRETPPPELPLRRFSFTTSSDIATFNIDSARANLAISPDGRHIALATVGRGSIRQLWVQDLDQSQPRLITEADGLAAPFWSPGSDSIAFAARSGDALELRRVSVQGGPSSRVCELPGIFFGGAWSPDGEIIVFSAASSTGPPTLYQVPAGGGGAKLLFAQETPSDSEERPEVLNWPHFLPAEAGSRVLVYADRSSTAEHTLIAHDLTTGRREMLGPGAFPVYALSGHLVFQASLNNYDLLAAPFSLKSLQFTGERFPIRENAGYPSVACDGTLVYLESSGARMKQMVWRDRRGTKIGTIGQPQLNLEMPELSPDGRRVLVRSTETGNYDIWVHDVARGVKQRLTFDPAMEVRPIWLPKGDRISFSSDRRGEGGPDIYVQSADGTGDAELLVGSPAAEFAYDWSADETYVVFTQGRPEYDLYYLKRKDDGSGYDSNPFVVSPFDTRSPKLSPDGKYLAYESNESGTYEVYVQPFPQGGGKPRVSVNGGRQPRWRGDGKELFYVEGNAIVAVPVTTAGGFTAGEPQRLFEAAPGAFVGPGDRYTVTPDGQKFILVEDADGDDAAIPAIQVTQNWFAEFKGRQRE